MLTNQFTPLASLLGGVLIGLAAALLLLGQGRIAGVVGILGGAIHAQDRNWRLLFIAGLIVGGAAFAAVRPAAFLDAIGTTPALLIAAGLLVGFGARLSNGCTSGHGVCGLGRLSRRSFWATLTFMAAGGLVVFAARHLGGPKG